MGILAQISQGSPVMSKMGRERGRMPHKLQDQEQAEIRRFVANAQSQLRKCLEQLFNRPPRPLPSHTVNCFVSEQVLTHARF